MGVPGPKHLKRGESENYFGGNYAITRLAAADRKSPIGPRSSGVVPQKFALRYRRHCMEFINLVLAVTIDYHTHTV